MLADPYAVDPAADISWPEFWAVDRAQSEWLFDDVLALGRGHALWAKPGSMKSLFILWITTRLISAGHVVLYLDYEMGTGDLQERLEAMGHGPDSDLSRLHYVPFPQLAPLDTDAGGRGLDDKVNAVQAEHPGLHVAVIVDTISRAVQGPENDNDTALAFYRHTGLRLQRRGVTWARLDHAGWAGGHARGASAKLGDVDVDWEIRKTDTGIELTRHKARMGWVPSSVTFNLHDDPLRFEPVRQAWPAGTHALADKLARLGVPVSATQRQAIAVLKAASPEGKAGHRTALISKALDYRRAAVGGTEAGRIEPGITPGITPQSAQGITPGITPQKPLAHGQESERESLGTAQPSVWESVDSPYGESLNPAPQSTTGYGSGLERS